MKRQHPLQANRCAPSFAAASLLALFVMILSERTSIAAPNGASGTAGTTHTNQDRIGKRSRNPFLSPLWWSHTNQDGYDPPDDPQNLLIDDPISGPWRPSPAITGNLELAKSAITDLNFALQSAGPPSALHTPAITGIPGPGALLPILTLTLLTRRRRRTT